MGPQGLEFIFDLYILADRFGGTVYSGRIETLPANTMMMTRARGMRLQSCCLLYAAFMHCVHTQDTRDNQLR
jgi:hypothetical protein